MSDSLIGKEIFVVASEECDEGDFGAVFFSDKIGELKEFLSQMDPEVDSYTRVYHGVLQTAEYLPSSIRNKNVFLVCLDPGDPEKGYVMETNSDTVAELSKELAAVLNGDEIFEGSGKPSTEYIYLLYGYQLKVCLSINDEDLDEEKINVCKEISEEIDGVEAIVARTFQ